LIKLELVCYLTIEKGLIFIFPSLIYREMDEETGMSDVQV